MRLAAALCASFLVAGVAAAQAPADAGVAETPAPQTPESSEAEPAPEAAPTPQPAPAPVPEPEVEPALRVPAEPELDPFDDYDHYRLWMELRAELEFVNVEGPGGFSRRDASRVAPHRRAPYVDVDKVTLDVYTHLWPFLLTRLELRADLDRARIDRAYVEIAPWDDPSLGRLLFQVGRERPFIRPPGRHVETYSPTALILWRNRSWHAGAELTLTFEPVELRACVAAALTRPLGSESMGEDPNLPTVAYGDYSPDDDTTIEGQALLGAAVFGAHLEAFGGIGELWDNQGPDLLNRTFEQYDLLGNIDDRTSVFYGARAYFEEYGVFVLAEVAFQNLGLLFRRAWEIGGSYDIAFDVEGYHFEIEPFFRYGSLTLTNLPEDFFTPQTWDREQIVVALLLRPIDIVEIKIEYLFLLERAGTSAEGATSVRDDQLLVQLLLHTEFGVVP